MKGTFQIPAISSKRSLIVFLALIMSFFSGSFFAQQSLTLKKVVLDAGHGGSDPGNLGTSRYKTTEKDITLSVTLKLGEYIKENFPDVEVIYTRKDDSYPTLKERVELANDEQADLFISIHCDAFTKSSARGSSTFVMGMHKTKESLRVAMSENASIFKEENYEENYSFDPNDPDTYLIMTLRQNVFLDNSLELSNGIQSQFKDRVGRVDRGVKQAGFYVISYTSMPSVLVELGFLTNHEEEDFLNSEDGQVYMASAIFRAFRDYKNKIEETAKELEDSLNTVEQKEEEVVPVIPVVDEDIKPYTDLNKVLTYEKIKKGPKFQVQIMSSSIPLGNDDEGFKGIRRKDEYYINGLYKYAVGCTADYAEAKKMQKALRENGFEGAFVIAFMDDERVELHEALNETK